MNELLILSTLLSAALMVGNEFTVGAFINPAFDHLPEQPQAYAARETARVFGRVMPFWMAANLLLNILLVFPGADRYSASWWFYLTAAVLFAFVIVFNSRCSASVNGRKRSFCMGAMTLRSYHTVCLAQPIFSEMQRDPLVPRCSKRTRCSALSGGGGARPRQLIRPTAP